MFKTPLIFNIGLLGPNGCGKSSSFNILTAAIPKTTGSAKLFGAEIKSSVMPIYEKVGICAQ